MSGEGAPKIEIDGSGYRIAIVATRWHETIMSALIAGAEEAASDSGAEYDVFRVAGSFELPLAAQRALDEGYDAVACLGVIIRGETPHFDYVCKAVTDGLTRVTLDAGLPVGFGVLTVDTEEQALNRAGLPDSRESKGHETVEAILDSLQTLDDMSS